MKEKYLEKLRNLSTAKRAGRSAPHKAVLLLSIMDLIESGEMKGNRIVLSERLEEKFLFNWRRYIGASPLFPPKVATPFWHLQSEPFYSLYRNDGEDLSSYRSPYSVRRLREDTYALIDGDLFNLMKEPTARAELRVTLISTYLTGQHGRVEKPTAGLLSLLALFLQMAA